MTDDHVGEAWRAGWKGWLEANLPAALAAVDYAVREGGEQGDRPQCCVVVAFERVERVPSMTGTGRVRGGIAMREPFDLGTVEDHRARVAALWAVLKTVGVKGGPLDGVYLHDLRWEDRESVVDDGDRVAGWPVSSMCTRCGEA